MATLASQILADIQVIVASAHLVDLTNQRDADSSVDTTILTKACDYAAAKVASYLGSVTGTDTLAVDIGVRWAVLQLSSSYSLLNTGGDTRAGLIAELKELQAIRRTELAMQYGSPDFGFADTLWMDGTPTNDLDNPDNHD